MIDRHPDRTGEFSINDASHSSAIGSSAMNNGESDSEADEAELTLRLKKVDATLDKLRRLRFYSRGNL